MDEKRGVGRQPQSSISLGQPPPDRLSELEIIVGVDGDDSACRFGSVSESGRDMERPTVSEKENTKGLDVYIHPTTFPEFLHEFEHCFTVFLPLFLERVSEHVRRDE